jgi:cation diffusion facilitator family transporter
MTTSGKFPKAGTSLTKFALISILAALATLALKTSAYIVTNSVGLFSDALESCVNLLAALTMFLSLRYAAKPVDATHTYGHEKIEFFASGLEGMLILVAGVSIIWLSMQRLLFHPPLEDLGIGVLIASGASFINFVVARILLHAARKHQSIVLESDGQHLMTDVWTSLAVVLGLGLVHFTNIYVLDPLIATAMAVHILRVGYNLVLRSFNGLMDHALPEHELEVIRKTIREHLPTGASFHAIRSRQAGAHRFLDFHLLVPGNTSVQQAHDWGESIESALSESIEHLEVTIHIEPIEAEASFHDNELIGIEPEQPMRT